MPVKQNKYFLMLMMIVSVMLASMAAKAQTEIEMSCRAKAKEVALQAYEGCVTETRATRLQEIRDGYKSEMADVKAKYDRMMQEISPSSEAPAEKPGAKSGGKAAPTRSVQNKGAAKNYVPETPVIGMAKKLPAKQNNNGPARPMNSVDEIPQAVVVPRSASETVTLPESGDLSKQDTSGFM
ncbi:MAG: hypothetical protein KF802_02015 [Bdellovibrionaceae bacterium]|nr:hypothetical protein [Pseudobdellovibrionaceae bacterium]MBX3033907.1 hypothetical protein [Pseudobdellovibrionaceae bacterium]